MSSKNLKVQNPGKQEATEASFSSWGTAGGEVSGPTQVTAKSGSGWRWQWLISS